MVSAVDKAIRDAGLGVNPVVAGQLIRIPIPPLSSERRTELTKVAHKYAEHARVAIRNVRRDGNDMLKKMEKDGDLSEDEHRLWADEIQEMTDRHIKIIDEQLAQKDAEILQV
jgi:ribosome recycling factor